MDIEDAEMSAKVHDEKTIWQQNKGNYKNLLKVGYILTQFEMTGFFSALYFILYIILYTRFFFNLSDCKVTMTNSGADLIFWSKMSAIFTKMSPGIACTLAPFCGSVNVQPEYKLGQMPHNNTIQRV